jgi:hypothetical protein
MQQQTEAINFRTFLRNQLTTRGLTKQTASRLAGLNDGWVSGILMTARGSDEAIRRIGELFDATPDDIAAWIAEERRGAGGQCECGCGNKTSSLEYRFLPGHFRRQQPPGDSWLQRTRVRMGFPTTAALALAAGISNKRVLSWETDGRRPTWGHIRTLATLLNVTEEEAVAGLWPERVGDRCECGCGNRKVLPTAATAMMLAVELKCPNCGRMKPVSETASRNLYRHRANCRACSGLNRRSDRQTFTCVGYQDHGVVRHASSCLGTRTLSPGRIGSYKRAAITRQRRPRGRGTYSPAVWDKPFLNEETGKFRCARCARGSMAIAKQEMMLKTVTSERIRSKKQRRELMSEFSAIINPRFHNSIGEARRRMIAKKKTEGLTHRQRTADSHSQFVRAWSADALPVTVTVALCASCKKLLIFDSDRTHAWHPSCFQSWLNTLEGRRFLKDRTRRPSQREAIEFKSKIVRQGRLVADDVVKRHFSWAVQHLIGRVPLSEIARRQDKSRQAIQLGIDRIVQALPESGLLVGSGARWRHMALVGALNSLLLHDKE